MEPPGLAISSRINESLYCSKFAAPIAWGGRKPNPAAPVVRFQSQANRPPARISSDRAAPSPSRASGPNAPRRSPLRPAAS